MSTATVIQPAETATLYERLGRAEGIAAIVDDVIEAHMQHPAIKVRFAPYKSDPARLAELKQHLCRFLGAGSGGPDVYSGRTMPEAHRGMNISEREYMAALDDIVQTLQQHGVDEQTQKDVLAIAYGLKDEIMHN